MNARLVVTPLALLLVVPGSFAAQDNVLKLESGTQSEVVEQQTVPPAAPLKTFPAAGSRPAVAPASGAAKSPSTPATVGLPDIPPERVYSAGRRAEPRLWQLLNTKRYAELNSEIQRLQSIDSAWHPPAELIYWLRHHLKLQSTAKSSVRLPIPATTRSTPPKNQAKNRANAAKPHTNVAIAPPAHIHSSSKASAGRSPRLANRPVTSPSSSTTDARYGAAITAAARLDRAGQATVALNRLEPWAGTIQQRRDAGALELLAWLRFNSGHFVAALSDFRQATAWRPTASAAQGEMLALERLGQFTDLTAAARRSAQRWPELRKAAANGLRAAAAQQHQTGAYSDATALLAEANELSPPDRGARLLSAWNDFKLEHWRPAADQFAVLYRETPDEESAQGLLLSLKRLDATTEAADMAREPGHLQTLWRRDLAESHYQAKRFLAAHALDPQGMPALEHIDSPSIAGGLAGRWRAGDSGMGRLEEWQVPVAAYQYRRGTLSGQLALHRTTLNSGSLPPGQPVGSPPPTAPSSYSFTPTTELDGGLGWALTLRQEGNLTLDAQFGMTPTGGELAPRLYADLSIAGNTDHYGWRLNAHSRPVTESLLSYTGIRDPYTGAEWGRVFRHGVELQGWHTIAPQWTVAGTVRADAYRGQAVADNSGSYARLAIGRDLQLSDFDYFNIGPVLDFRRFDKNLSHFTYGQGGYYSPQRDIGLGLAVNAQTKEGQDWLLRIEANAGLRHQYEAASPWLPLTADQRFFASSQQTGFSGSLKLQGVWRLAPQWQLGAAARYERSPSFEQGGAYLFVRYLLEPRPAVFSSDLADGMSLSGE